MSEDAIIYEVSIVEKQADGRNDIRILLRTRDREEANALVGSLEQDGVRARMEVHLPRKKR